MRGKIVFDGTLKGLKQTKVHRKIMTYIYGAIALYAGYKTVEQANLYGRSSMVYDTIEKSKEELTEEDEI